MDNVSILSDREKKNVIQAEDTVYISVNYFSRILYMRDKIAGVILKIIRLKSQLNIMFTIVS